MSDSQSIIEGLYGKIEGLIELHKKTKDKNFKIINENKELSEIIEKQKNTVYDLQESNKVIKIANSLSDSDDSTLGVKLKINELVREIDKCIAYLNK